MMLKMLPFKLLLVAVVLCFFEGDAKFGESGARRRRCLNGTPPRRLKKRDRRVLSPEAPGGGEAMCRGLYPRLSCCSRTDAQGLLHAEAKIISVTNNTECAKLLEEIKCAHCSPHAQNLFHSPEKGETPERELTLPYLCKDYCKEFFYTCRGHIPGFLQTTADEFCFYYARKDGGVCFPDFPRKQVRGPASNSLDHMEEYDKEEEISRKHKHNCFCIQEVVSGLRQPVGAVHCGDGSHRLFILEKEGYVKIFSPEGDILKEPFLDIHKLVQSGIKDVNTCSVTATAAHLRPQSKIHWNQWGGHTDFKEVNRAKMLKGKACSVKRRKKKPTKKHKHPTEQKGFGTVTKLDALRLSPHFSRTATAIMEVALDDCLSKNRTYRYFGLTIKRNLWLVSPCPYGRCQLLRHEPRVPHCCDQLVMPCLHCFGYQRILWRAKSKLECPHCKRGILPIHALGR